MLTLNQISYIHTNGDVVFNDIHLAINPHDKIALIGNNGSGKSTLLRILATELRSSSGTVHFTSKPYYVPQHTGQFDDVTVGEALQVHDRLKALKEILSGHVTEENLLLLNEDWLVEERCRESLAKWNLSDVPMDRQMKMLSGGQKTKIFLSGIAIHQPESVLLDEPSNHLDTMARDVLYDYVKTTSHTLIVVSHDKTLLNLLHTTCELSKSGLTVYGGNYDFYSKQKKIETAALSQDLNNAEKTLHKARETEREALERRQKLDARGKKKQEKAGLPRISMKTFKNGAEKSTSHIKDVHAEKIGSLVNELKEIRKALPNISAMKMNLDHARLHKGKRVIEAININFAFGEKRLWTQPLNFLITSGDRIVLKGQNGSGKTTLVRMLTGQLQPTTGLINRADIKSMYIDQDYSLINSEQTVYEQAEQFNIGLLSEHELKIRLNRFLFTKEFWNRSCQILSGGEKMRLMLCCLIISSQVPDMILLDEPTNNLDIQNTEILTAVMKEYQGTLIVVSHDGHFLKEMNIERAIWVG